jgi:endonuclease III
MIATRATRSGARKLASQIIKAAETVKAAETACDSLPDIEDTVPQSDSSLTSVESEPPTSPSKKRKASSSKVTHIRVGRKRVGELLSQPPPSNWEEVYAEIKAMRATINAPVDTMGCEQLGKTETDPKVCIMTTSSCCILIWGLQNGRFATLVGLMLSSQTKDEVTFLAMQSLREALGGSVSVEAMIATPIQAIEKAIGKVGFWRRKAE